jgi:hypothetical protein
MPRLQRSLVPLRCCMSDRGVRCDSAITTSSLEALGFGRGEVLLWPLPKYVHPFSGPRLTEF